MPDPGYSFRSKRGASPVEYRVASNALIRRDADSNEASLSYSDIREIRVYRSPGVYGQPAYFACVVVPVTGPKIAISSRHFGGDGSLEDRSGAYRAFERGLFERAAKANPAIAFVRGGQVVWIIFAVLLGIVALFGGSVLFSLASGFIRGPQQGEDAWITLVIALVLILLAIPGVRLLYNSWSRAFDPLAPDV